MMKKIQIQAENDEDYGERGEEGFEKYDNFEFFVLLNFCLSHGSQLITFSEQISIDFLFHFSHFARYGAQCVLCSRRALIFSLAPTSSSSSKGKTQRRPFSPEHTTRQISISKQLFYDRMLESDGELVDEGEKKSNSNQTERYEWASRRDKIYCWTVKQ